MLVDDHAEFRTVLRGFLETQESVGVVAEAENGLAAVELANQAQPDLILMDISMPRMDGFSATQEIKRRHPDIAVVFVSFYDEERYRQAAIEIGAEGFISKASLAKDLPGVLETLRKQDPIRSSLLSSEKSISHEPLSQGSGQSRKAGSNRYS